MEVKQTRQQNKFLKQIAKKQCLFDVMVTIFLREIFRHPFPFQTPLK